MSTQPFPLRIDFENVSASLGGKTVLHALSWSLREGEHWAILGANGAGKSSALRLLSGELRAQQNSDGSTMGRVLWNLEGYPDPSPLAVKALCRSVSAEQQRFYLRKGWEFSGAGLIASAFTNSLLPSPVDEAGAATVRDIANLLHAEHLLALPISAMSQGQLRLILLARAMAAKPRLLLLDEAFDGLDSSARNTLHAAVDRAAGAATIVATAHREADLPSCITHALYLEQGRIVHCGPLTRHEKRETSSGACACSVSLSARANTRPADGEKTLYGPFALELENVDVYVDRAKILHGLNWKMPLGQSWRIAGANGSGKSTLLRLLAGFEQVALGGKLVWFGQEFPKLEQRSRESGYLSDQLHATYTYDLTGLELILSGIDGSVGLWRETSRKEREQAWQWMESFGLADMAKTPVSRLSSGTARRFFLARALMGPVRLLLLDEPCSGLDIQARSRFLQTLRTVMDSGIQCVYVTHHDDELPLGVSHELRLEAGRIVGAGKISG